MLLQQGAGCDILLLDTSTRGINSGIITSSVMIFKDVPASGKKAGQRYQIQILITQWVR